MDEMDELDHLLEELERSAERVDNLKEIVKTGERKKKSKGSSEEEEIPESKKWTVSKAEALAKTKDIEQQFVNGEKSVSNLTGAIKSHEANLHESKKGELQGQQKWRGEFETEYQRERGITTNQSLEEIENWAFKGEAPETKPSAVRTTGSEALRSKLSSDLVKKSRQRKPGRAKSIVGKAGGSSMGVERNMSRSGARSQQREAPNAAKRFTAKLKNGGNQGSKFFERFQERENNKYKPGRGQ